MLNVGWSQKLRTLKLFYKELAVCIFINFKDLLHVHFQPEFLFDQNFSTFRWKQCLLKIHLY